MVCLFFIDIVFSWKEKHMVWPLIWHPLLSKITSNWTEQLRVKALTHLPYSVNPAVQGFKHTTYRSVVQSLNWWNTLRSHAWVAAQWEMYCEGTFNLMIVYKTAIFEMSFFRMNSALKEERPAGRRTEWEWKCTVNVTDHAQSSLLRYDLSRHIIQSLS